MNIDNKEYNIDHKNNKELIYVNRIMKLGNSYYFNLPKWFIEKNNIKIGDNYIIKLNKIK